MSALSDLYDKISQANTKLVKKWLSEANKRIKKFVKNIAKSAPFLDKPNKRMFGTSIGKDDSLKIFGNSPNAGRMRRFGAPVGEWVPTREGFRFFGAKGWQTIHKIQKTSRSAGVPIKDVPYLGTSERPKKYFGIKKGRITLAYGKTRDDLSLPVYAATSYPDWVMERYSDDIKNIIMDAGNDILSQYMERRK